MKRIIINMQSYLMSDAIRMALLNNADLSVNVVEDTDEVVKKSFLLQADLVVMEVTEYPPCILNERLLLRNQIKLRCPNCKIALIINENEDFKLVEQVKRAKTDGLIDLFIFGSVSAKYLIALLETA